VLSRGRRKTGRGDSAVQETIRWIHRFRGHTIFSSRIYRWNGDYAASVEERAISLDLDGNPEGAKRVRESFANGGWSGFKRMLQQNYSGPMSRGELDAVEKDTTIEKLNGMAAEGSFWLFLIKTDPLFDPVRGDPRFQELVKKFNPPQ